MTFEEATNRLGAPLKTVAAAVGRTYPTVMAYRQGRREPPTDVWLALAEFAQERIAEVRRDADEQASSLERLARQLAKKAERVGAARERA